MKTQLYTFTWEEIYRRIDELQYVIQDRKVYGVPRGGQIVAGLIGNAVDTPEQADVIVDDLIDSGTTEQKWKALFPNKPFIALFNKQLVSRLHGKWLHFPWESNPNADLKDYANRLLQHHGLDVQPKHTEMLLSHIESLVNVWKKYG